MHQLEHRQYSSLLGDLPLLRSALRKAVRRGRPGVAVEMAEALWLRAPHLLQRTLLFIALDEVGNADLALVAEVTETMPLGILPAGSIRIFDLVERLADAPKCQAAADLMWVAQHSPRLTRSRTSCAALHAINRIAVATSPAASLEERAVYARFLAAKLDSSARSTRARTSLFFDKLQRDSASRQSLDIARRVFDVHRWPGALGLALLATTTPLVSSPLALTEAPKPFNDGEIEGIPFAAFDVRTQLGAWALALAAKNDVELKKWLRSAVFYWEHNVAALGYLLEIVEGKAVERRRTSSFGVELHYHACSANIMIKSSELIVGTALMKEKLCAINAFRWQACEMRAAGH